MAQKRLKRPRDPLALAKMIGDIATEQAVDLINDERDQAAVALGRRGGKKRAESMSPERRSDIARRAAASRWKKD